MAPTLVQLASVGQTWEAGSCSWDGDDAVLYALGVGAGRNELAFSTENTEAAAQQVLPTFPVILHGDHGQPSLGDFPLSAVLHAEQSVELAGPLPVAGTAQLSGAVIGVYDKGRDAQIVTESVITGTGALAGRHIATVRASIFVRGAGGFGGERGLSAAWQRPDRPADQVVSYPVPADQALLYRLSGDRNPLHSDPTVAREAGFPGPILHGLCTFGYTGRALLHAACAGRVERFHSMAARFTAPVLPGQTLDVHIWQDGSTALFQTLVDDVVVLDRGTARVLP